MFTKPNNEEGYTSVDFTEEETIVSSQFDQLVLSVKELLNPPIVEELIKEEQTTIKTLAEQAENERQRAETLEQQVDTLEQRAENERQRAEKLAQRLLEMGINPED